MRDLLGRPKVHPEHIQAENQVGVATGMFYTPMGGDIMFVEASIRRFYGNRSNDSSDSQLTAGPVLSPEDQMMAEATQLCAAGDCQSAHDRLKVGLGPSSPLRQSPAFKDLENKWATTTIAGATDDPDVMQRRAELTDLIASAAVDPALKAKAAATLNALPTKPIVYDAGPLPVDPGSDAGALTKKGGKKHH